MSAAIVYNTAQGSTTVAPRPHPVREAVAVTGAGGQVGQALLRALPADVRRIALVRPETYVPAEWVLAGRLDSPQAADALREADVVVHLAGALRPRGGSSYREANLETTERVAAAVREGRARRILFLSYVGADRGSRNEYLSLKAEAEEVLRGTGREVVVFRCTHIIGSPDAPGPTAEALLSRDQRTVNVLGSGCQRVAPVYAGDVVAALLAALLGGPAGTYELAGPQVLTMDDLVRLVNQSWFPPMRHVPGPLARIVAESVPGLPAPLVDVMTRDSLGDSEPARDAFGLTLTSLRDVWRRR
jgi:NADH dehydrogenase